MPDKSRILFFQAAREGRKVLNGSNLGLDDNDIPELVNALKDNRQSQELNLDNNRITTEGAKKLLNELYKYEHNIKTLSLTNNEIVKADYLLLKIIGEDIYINLDNHKNIVSHVKQQPELLLPSSEASSVVENSPELEVAGQNPEEEISG